MAHSIISLKLLLYLCSNLAIPTAITMFSEVTRKPEPPMALFWIVFCYLFIMEVLLIFPQFRVWIKVSLEDGDGVFNIEDRGRALFNWLTIWSVRVFVLASIVPWFWNVTVADNVYMYSFLGALGFQGANIARKKLNI